MEFRLYKDIWSLTPIRCISPVSGTSYFAEGTGVLASTAIEKCRSERIEREFQIRSGINPIGIAAHPDKSRSVSNAFQEATESLMLQKILSSRKMLGFPVLSSKILSIYVTRVNSLWFTFLRGAYAGKLNYTYSARTSFLSSLLQAWIEHRNLFFYRLDPEKVIFHSKANRMFDKNPPKLTLSLKAESVYVNDLEITTVKENNHFISYITKGEKPCAS